MPTVNISEADFRAVHAAAVDAWKDAYDAARAHFAEYGAWSEEEIAEWSAEELRATLIQDVAASIRANEDAGAEEDGRSYTGDDGRLYFWLGV